jgi:hypothetical protein
VCIINLRIRLKQLVLVLCYETAARIQDAKDSVGRVAGRSGYSCYIKIPHTIMSIPAANPLSFFLKGVLKKSASSLLQLEKVYWVSPCLKI